MQLTLHEPHARQAAFGPDGKTLVVTVDEGDGVVRILDTSGGGAAPRDVPCPISPSYVWLSRDGRTAAVTGYKTGRRDLCLVDLAALTSHVIVAPKRVQAVAVSHDGATVAVANWDEETASGQVRLHDAATGAVIRDMEPLTAAETLFFSGDGFTLVGVNAREVRTWTLDGRTLGTLPHPDDTESAVVGLTPDGTELFVGYQTLGRVAVADFEGRVHRVVEKGTVRVRL